MADRFLIAPYDQESSLQTDLKPFAIPDQAFAQLDNAYAFRGRIRKRFGSRWFENTQFGTRLRINIGTTDGAGNFAANVRLVAIDLAMPTAVGQAFSIGNTMFTVYNAALGPQQMYRSDGLANVATYDLTNSAVNLTNADPTTAVYFYPGFPVMGLLSFEQTNINDELCIAFDTRYAYRFIAGFGWERLNGEAAAGDSVWTGNNSQFFWGYTWTGIDAFNKTFYVTNFNETEPNYLRYFDGAVWHSFRPTITVIPVPQYLNSARLVVPFKDRLLYLNTWEGAGTPGDHYPNRCRYSWTPGSPLNADAFRQDLPGHGNAIDAATTESIVTAEFIKDRLIVYFERSTWEIAYTGNQAYPFTWQQINTELGAESTFSIVPFDKVCLGVGNVGIHACNGSNVERIDNKIPQAVFDIHNADQGVERVYGIRDYETEMVYWSMPGFDVTPVKPYPTRVMVYNYRTGAWAFNDDSITCFGYFQPTNGVTWGSTTTLWNSTISWGGGAFQAQFRQVVAGNQQGYTFVINTDEPTNASVLQITDITIAPANVVAITSINNNLRQGDYVYFEEIVASGNLALINGNIFQISRLDASDPNIFYFVFDQPIVLAGVYQGGGVMARVSKINIKTKEFNFYAKQGRNAYLSKVDFLVDSTAHGQIQANYYVSTSPMPMLTEASASNTIMGTGTLDTFPYTFGNAAAPIPFETNAERLWHLVYFQGDGEFVQLQLTFNNDQMRDVDISESDFQLHAICMYATPTSFGFR